MEDRCEAPPTADLSEMEQAWVDWMDDEDYYDELRRLCNTVAELRQALDHALTCTAIWCSSHRPRPPSPKLSS